MVIVDKMDSVRIVLSQRHNLNGEAKYNSCRYNVKFGGQFQNFEKYRLYVDNFNIFMDGLSLAEGLGVRLNVINSRTYSSRTNGPDGVILLTNREDTASSIDHVVYQAPQSPIELDRMLDGEIEVEIITGNGELLDLQTNTNHWNLILRVEMYNSVAPEPLADVQNFNKKRY